MSGRHVTTARWASRERVGVATAGGAPRQTFNVRRRRGRVELQDQCRSCRAAYTRKHYLDNKADYIKRARTRGARVRQENKHLILQYLLEHPCEVCGETDPVVLEFHHRDPKAKEFTVTRAITLSWKRLLAEIQKCRVLCANDHRREHARLQKTFRSTWRSG